MAKPITSKKRASALSTSLFLVGLAILIFLDKWWPGIMLVIGIPLALRQYLLGRLNDAVVSLAIFVGFFIISQFNLNWRILLPILFIIGALYIISREFLESFREAEDESEEDLMHELEERQKKKKH